MILCAQHPEKCIVFNNRQVLSKAGPRSKQHFLKKLKVEINIDGSEIISPHIDESVKIVYCSTVPPVHFT